MLKNDIRKCYNYNWNIFKIICKSLYCYLYGFRDINLARNISLKFNRYKFKLLLRINSNRSIIFWFAVHAFLTCEFLARKKTLKVTLVSDAERTIRTTYVCRIASLRRFHVRLVKKWSSFCMNLFFPSVPRNWCLIVRALQPLERRAINNLSGRFLHVGFVARSKGYATSDGHVSASGTGFHEDGRGVRIEVHGPTKAYSRSKGKRGDDWK